MVYINSVFFGFHDFISHIFIDILIVLHGIYKISIDMNSWNPSETFAFVSR
jgi:hypothetical protein